MREREYRENPHPPYCTCVQCTERRRRASAAGRNPVARLWRAVKRALGM